MYLSLSSLIVHLSVAECKAKRNEQDDKWFLEFPSEMSVKREKCANVKVLVYEMQVRLRESLWS